MRSTRTFYHLVHPILCRFNARNHRSSGLLFAATNGLTDLVENLFAADASIGASDRTTDSREYELRVVDGSLDKPGNDPRRCLSRPPFLHWALRFHKIEIVDLMLAEGAPLDVPVNMGSIYEEKGAEFWEYERPHPWYEAAVQREGQMLQLLLKHGRRPKSDKALDPANGGLDIRVHGHPALFTAVEKGHFDMVKYLNPNLRCNCYDINGPYSTVSAAVQARRMDILEFFVTEQGVRPDEKDIPSYAAAMKRRMKLKRVPGFDIVTRSPLRCPTSEAEWYFIERPGTPEWH
ncbi:hypothetical protein N8T08_005961 [Aspergillus melleus]|uniref:Uncharacterized protein n=1 Tax=Aspergillus melleus TaxID=138277 RepID=A0ACC3B115_9EURO|nr:hypothetical protein N8T08_005961 [Aspergillus melleus]